MARQQDIAAIAKQEMGFDQQKGNNHGAHAADEGDDAGLSFHPHSCLQAQAVVEEIGDVGFYEMMGFKACATGTFGIGSDVVDKKRLCGIKTIVGNDLTEALDRWFAGVHHLREIGLLEAGLKDVESIF